VVFTGGVGERSAPVRSAACRGLEFLGIELDEERNRTAAPEAQISAPGSPVAVLVVTAREDLQIASEVRSVLKSTRAPK
jgi:acetate kinase